MKLSIVLPVYGVENYIRECVLSIINQTDGLFREIELIIVNDGTRDHSIERIQDLIENKSNIVLINQENQGLSAARNNGLSRAHGDYVWFIDSDDWITSDALNVLFPYLDGKNDTIVMGAEDVFGNYTNIINVFFPKPKTLKRLENYQLGCEQTTTSVLTVYKRDFLHDNSLRFMLGVFHEDYEFSTKVSYYSNHTLYIPNPLYRIRRSIADGRQSITTVVNPKRAFDALKVASSLSEFNRNVVKENEIRNKIDDIICQCVNNGALNLILQCSFEERVRFNDIYRKNYSFLTNNIIKGRFRYKLEGLLFLCFPNNITGVYKIMQLFNIRRIMELINSRKTS